MSLGAGFEYLMSSVARGDGGVSASSPLTAYYAESGSPPGRFLGRGLAGLDDGRGATPGSEVSEEALWRLLGMLADPVTGQPLGHRPARQPATLSTRIADRVAALPAGLDDADRVAAVAVIEAEEKRRTVARPVAAFDLTFSVPKSVSTLWALADPTTQAVILQAHRDAIQHALTWAEDHIMHTRVGKAGAIQEAVRGVVAAAFDHWDSRAGDPHLHTHVVITNRVQTTDGAWRTLDSQTLHRYVVALSELHEGVVMDLLTDRLGVAWTEHPRRHSPVSRHDIDGIPRALLEEFSTRARQIEASKNDLADAFAARHGRRPSRVEILKLRQQATLQTRPDKQHRPLADQMQQWADRAASHLPAAPGECASRVLHRNPLPALTGHDLSPELLDELAARALATVAQKRSVFGPANVLAEIHRQLHGVRFASPQQRTTVADRLTTDALQQAVRLDAGADNVSVDAALRRADGSSKLVHRGSEVYSTQATIDAEARLLDAARTTTAPTATAGDLPAVLDQDQAAAVVAITGSGRHLDLLIGPAGSGKTTTLTALAASWERLHGPGSVTGLAPSAAAAAVLATEVDIVTDNTAKWLHEQAFAADRTARIDALRDRLDGCSSRGSILARRISSQLRGLENEHARWTITPGQLVIIDEAGLAGTHTLDTIVTAAAAAGGKVLLVGDWAQLSAVDAGGAFAMLAHDRPDTPELGTLHRFHHQWERDATLRIRTGDPTVCDTYDQHDRIRSGDTQAMLDQLYEAWARDVAAGRSSLMITSDNDTARQLNLRARAAAITAGNTTADGVQLADGTAAGTGDLITTRRNDRTLRTSTGGWVRNGDTWTITERRRNGSITATAGDGTTVTLDADYVAQHVELGYATTTHRTQGRTVDTAHALITNASSREQLYVAATRGRTANTMYVDPTPGPADVDTAHYEQDTARDIITAVIGHSDGERSAHEIAALHRATLRRTDAAARHHEPQRIEPAEPLHATLGL